METTQLLAILNDPKKYAVLLFLMIWAMIWKGVALWRTSQNKQLYWFIAIFVLNTFGIAEILYLAFFQKKQEK